MHPETLKPGCGREEREKECEERPSRMLAGSEGVCMLERCRSLQHGQRPAWRFFFASHLSRLVEVSRVEKHPLRHRRLSRVNVCHDPDVSHAFEAVCGWARERSPLAVAQGVQSSGFGAQTHADEASRSRGSPRRRRNVRGADTPTRRTPTETGKFPHHCSDAG